MALQHKSLAGRWAEFSFFEQMAHIGSEISRTVKWQKKGNKVLADKAFFRALELIDLSVLHADRSSKRKELLRSREALCDHFYFDNEYKSTDEQWLRYFDTFLLGLRVQQARAAREAR